MTTASLMPGVYRQDVYPPVPPVFLTGVPAFIGRAASVLPDGVQPSVPYRVTLWPQFEATLLPAADPEGYLVDAVRGFLGNGGVLCDVVLLDATLDRLTALRTALAALDQREDIDLVCVPDLIESPNWPPSGLPADGSEPALREITILQRTVLEHCESRGDRFAILDAVPSPDPQVVLAQRGELGGPAAAFGAVYYPWLRVPAEGQAPRFVPACGHVAGIYAEGDQGVGVHKAPANAVIDGVLDLQSSLSDAEIAALHAGSVNSLRSFPGRGIRVWGARTASDDPAWQDINVRRLISTIGRWSERFMVDLVHEPNDIRLWVRIMREFTAYLEGLYQLGALKGRTVDEAFYVKCDDETNPPELAQNGIVVTQIGVAAAVPAEFIVVRVIQGANGVTVNAA